VQPETRFLRSLADLDIRLPEPDEWDVIADVVARYSDFDLGAVDASVVVLAQRLGADTIATLDHRHFRAIRPAHVPAFALLP
jgi:predicted nucleic acid-binding protein